MSIAELESRYGLTRLQVNDPQYGERREYEGVLLRPLLEDAGLDSLDELLMQCSDGYAIALDTSLLSNPALVPMIAFRDTRPSKDSHWQLLEHGRETVDFDPFYVVWGTTNETRESAEQLPWPFQLTSIRPAGDLSPEAPPKGTDIAIAAGHETFVKHCLKCHQVQGTGGSLGPVLDREGSMMSFMDDDMLGRFIYQVNDFFPQTKMPSYASVLESRQIDNLVSYLRWVAAQPALPDQADSR
ncbi:MAG: c-type cytochrome [Pseudomonadota bacterium]